MGKKFLATTAPATSIKILDYVKDTDNLKDIYGEIVGETGGRTGLIPILAAIVFELSKVSDPTGTNDALQQQLAALQQQLADLST